MSGPTREQVEQWVRESITLSGALGILNTTELVALAFAAGQAAEREARTAAQQELAVCREAMTRAEHESQRARGEIAAAVANEREACAKVCEEEEVPIDIDVWMGTKKGLTAATSLGLAAAIRSRGQQ